ncbi:MAG: DMT family transporter [Chitinophagales bacterium]|nr:DMT family transporter [Bacteroidota bacterium]MCB9255614.1 DMT family transporter [Chitinophagales bacterium]
MSKNGFSSNVLILILLALIWGSSYILMKKGLLVFSAVQVSMLRIVFSTLALLPFLPRAIRNLNRKDFIFIGFVGLFGSGIPSYLFPLAISHIDSGVAGIINSLTPVFVLLFGWLFFKTALIKEKVIGLALAIVGASFLLFFKDSAIQFELNHYAFYAVLATICYGLSSNILKSKLSHVNSMELTSLSFALIGPFALLKLLSTDFMSIMQHDANAFQAISYIAILGFVGTALALVLFNYLIRKTDALYASTVTFMMPVVALAWAFVDGETLNINHYLGLAFILVGVYLTNKRWKKKLSE